MLFPGIMRAIGLLLTKPIRSLGNLKQGTYTLVALGIPPTYQHNTPIFPVLRKLGDSNHNTHTINTLEDSTMATINHPELTIKEEIKLLSKQRKELFAQISDLQKQADRMSETINQLYLVDSVYENDYLTLEF
jgi:hypothetical protein